MSALAQQNLRRSRICRLPLPEHSPILRYNGHGTWVEDLVADDKMMTFQFVASILVE